MSYALALLTLATPLAVVGYCCKPLFLDAEEKWNAERVLLVIVVSTALVGTFTSGWFMSALWYSPAQALPLTLLVWACLVDGFIFSTLRHFRRYEKLEKDFWKERRKEWALNEADQRDTLRYQIDWFLTDFDLAMLLLLEQHGPQIELNLPNGWGWGKGRNKALRCLWKLTRAGLIKDTTAKTPCSIAPTWKEFVDFEDRRSHTWLRHTYITSKGREQLAECLKRYKFGGRDRDSIERAVAERWSSRPDWKKYLEVKAGAK